MHSQCDQSLLLLWLSNEIFTPKLSYKFDINFCGCLKFHEVFNY